MGTKCSPRYSDRAEPTTAHVNAGISGTGPQEYLALGRAWISAVRPDLVVTYFFVGNDIDPVLAAYPCCEMEQLYAIESAAVRMRCASPRPASPRLAHMRAAMFKRVHRLWLSVSLRVNRNSLGISREP